MKHLRAAIRAEAIALGAKPGAICKWWKRDGVPFRYRYSILKALRSAGHSVEWDDLGLPLSDKHGHSVRECEAGNAIDVAKTTFLHVRQDETEPFQNQPQVSASV